ncbi:hypothetical protein Mgra_00001354 [Meloidogyne graminicola]|uniref:Cytochrome c oxidase polypeptide VIIc n=1 Tax=Meloidogyne graminicola TaxID=189291 RepID=A0A8T0A0P6_9BILA|nr:hypothetical protein Mgra_00001354 [Meloidogyne graminicola]
MSSICTNVFRPMLRPLNRKVHLPGTPGIYNSVPNWKPGPGWRPQSPQGPFLDGYAFGYWEYGRPIYAPTYLLKAAIYACSAFWFPFFVTEYQLKKQSKG